MSKEQLVSSNKIIFLGLENTLKDIPEPGYIPCCEDRKAQKEILTAEFKGTDTLECRVDVAGYGCTECGMKSYPVTEWIMVLRRVALVFEQIKDTKAAEDLLSRAVLIENTLAKTSK